MCEKKMKNMNRQFYFETKKNSVIVKMKNFNKDFFYWFFQHPESNKIAEYEMIGESLIIYNHNLHFIEKMFNNIFNLYIGYNE